MQTQIIRFGSYAGVPIEWQILTQAERRCLLLSRYVLDAKVFHPDCIYTGWESSSVREWLHCVFLPEAFTDSEQARILRTEVTTPCSPGLGNSGAVTVQDRLFLLSSAEAAQYLPQPSQRIAAAEPHAAAYSRDLRDFTALLPFYPGVQGCWWWLRDPGNEPNQMHIVWSDGSFCADGHYVNFERGIRPALWLTTS